MDTTNAPKQKCHFLVLIDLLRVLTDHQCRPVPHHLIECCALYSVGITDFLSGLCFENQYYQDTLFRTLDLHENEILIEGPLGDSKVEVIQNSAWIVQIGGRNPLSFVNGHTHDPLRRAKNDIFCTLYSLSTAKNFGIGMGELGHAQATLPQEQTPLAPLWPLRKPNLSGSLKTFSPPPPVYSCFTPATNIQSLKLNTKEN